MIRVAIAPVLVPALLLVLTGCASPDVSSPSLAIRPVEKLGFAEPEVTPPMAQADPALDARIAQLQARLDAVTRGFDAAATAAGRAAGAAGARSVGSERWLDAQAALAQLDDWRAQATALAGDVDAAAVERVGTGAATYPALTRLAATIRTEIDRQGREIARIQALLPAA